MAPCNGAVSEYCVCYGTSGKHYVSHSYRAVEDKICTETLDEYAKGA